MGKFLELKDEQFFATIAKFGLRVPILSATDVERELKNPYSLLSVQLYTAAVYYTVQTNFLLAACISMYHMLNRLREMAVEDRAHSFSGDNKGTIHYPGQFFHPQYQENPIQKSLVKMLEVLDKEILNLILAKEELLDVWKKYPTAMKVLFDNYETKALNIIKKAAEKDPSLQGFYEEVSERITENTEREDKTKQILKDADITIETSEDDIVRETGVRKVILGRELWMRHLYKDMLSRDLVTHEEVNEMDNAIKIEVLKFANLIDEKKDKVKNSQETLEEMLKAKFKTKLKDYTDLLHKNGDGAVSESTQEVVKSICGELKNTLDDKNMPMNEKAETIKNLFESMLEIVKNDESQAVYLSHQSLIQEMSDIFTQNSYLKTGLSI